MEKEKILIILGDEKNVKNISRYPKSSIVISENEDVKSGVKKLGFEFKKIDDYLNKCFVEDHGKEVIKLFRQWGNIKIKSQKLRDFLRVGNISYWDIIEGNFCSNIYHSNVLRYLDAIRNAVDLERITNIVIFDKNMGDIAETIARQKNIPTFFHYNRIKFCSKTTKTVFDVFIRHVNKLVHKRNRKHKIKYLNPSKNKILVPLFIESQTPVLAPVIRKLKEDEKNDVMVLHTSSIRRRMKKSLSKEGLEEIPIEAFWNKNVEKRVRLVSEKIIKKIDFLKRNKKFESCVTYKGMRIWEIMKDHFDYYYTTRLRIIEIIKYIETMRELLNSQKPDIIVLPDALSEIGKPTVILAKEMRIPTLFIQYGFFVKAGFIYGPSDVDKICVWGRQTKDLMVKRWFDPKKIVITGSPKFDKLVKKKFLTKREVCKKLNLDPNKEIFVFGSQMLPKNESFKITEMVFKAMKDYPEKQLVIKQHLREYNENLYKKLAKKIGLKNYSITKDFDIYDLVNSCDLLFTAYSTIGLEALILGKPVISINLAGRPDPLWFLSFGVATEVKTLSELKFAIKNARLEKRKIKGYINRMAYKIDGKSSERIIKIIYDMVRRK
jgi:UDP-N-acetylglucosamine 2-epimerase